MDSRTVYHTVFGNSCCTCIVQSANDVSTGLGDAKYFGSTHHGFAIKRRCHMLGSL